jgi:hypothetical protein
MMILLDAAPSNDEMFGFFIFFALIFLVWFIAKFFGPSAGATQMLAQSSDEGGGSSAMSKIVVSCIIIGVILWVISNIGTTPH